MCFVDGVLPSGVLWTRSGRLAFSKVWYLPKYYTPCTCPAVVKTQTHPQHDSARPRPSTTSLRTAQPKTASKMSENSKKAARVNSLKKKLQVRRAATGGPKGDFYIIGSAVKDEYDGLFVMERYHGKSIVVCLGPKSNDTKNPYQEVIRDRLSNQGRRRPTLPRI